MSAAVVILVLKPSAPPDTFAKRDGGQVDGVDQPWTYWPLFSIHVADSLVRSGFLVFLPFLLREKGADLPTIGFALSLLFAGGAVGNLAMGWLGARLGVVASAVLTEAVTTALIFALLPLSLPAALILLPLDGLILNGSSSVLKGTVPEFVEAKKRTHAFAVFYTGGSVAGAGGPILFGLLADVIGLAPTMAVVACTALLTIPLVWVLRRAFKSAPLGSPSA